MKLASLVVSAIMGCGGAGAAPVEVPVAEGPPASATAATTATAPPIATGATSSTTPTAPVAAKPACPATFGGGPAPACASGQDPGPCTYPEGTCACEAPVHCGGAAPPPMPPSWRCEAPRKPCPADGTPCKAGQTCHDGACAWQGAHECRQGTWRTVRVAPPP